MKTKISLVRAVYAFVAMVIITIDASEYCFISSPLHFFGPFSENVPSIR